MNLRWLRDAAVWWSVAIGALVLGAQHWWLWPVAVVALGAAQHALGNLGHEGLHFHVHPNRRINDVSAACCLWPLGFTVARWRFWHMRHHAFLGQPRRDPEVLLKLRAEKRWTRPRQYLRDACGLAMDEMPRFWADVHRGAGSCAFALPIAFATALAAVSPRSLALWLVAMLTSQTAIFRLRSRLEHDIDDLSTAIERERPPWILRTVVMPCRSWNHAEHHRHPAARF